MKDPTAIVEDPLTELLVFLVSIRLSPALLAALHRFVIHPPRQLGNGGQIGLRDSKTYVYDSGATKNVESDRVIF